MDGFFYPNQYTLENSPIGIMTASIVGKDSIGGFEAFIDNDLIRFRRNYGSFTKEDMILSKYRNVLNSRGYKIEARGVIQYLVYFETKHAYILILCQIFKPSDDYFTLFMNFISRVVFE